MQTGTQSSRRFPGERSLPQPCVKGRGSDPPSDCTLCRNSHWPHGSTSTSRCEQRSGDEGLAAPYPSGAGETGLAHPLLRRHPPVCVCPGRCRRACRCPGSPGIARTPARSPPGAAPDEALGPGKGNRDTEAAVSSQPAKAKGRSDGSEKGCCGRCCTRPQEPLSLHSAQEWIWPTATSCADISLPPLCTRTTQPPHSCPSQNAAAATAEPQPTHRAYQLLSGTRSRTCLPMGSGLVTVVLKKPSHSSLPYSPAQWLCRLPVWGRHQGMRVLNCRSAGSHGLPAGGNRAQGFPLSYRPRSRLEGRMARKLGG